MIRVYILALFLIAGSAFGQSSAAFDKDVYFPDPENPSDIKVFKGITADQSLGDPLINIGPGPKTWRNRILIANIYGNVGNLSIVNDGPNFISNFNNNLLPLNFSPRGEIFRLYNFHSIAVKDLLALDGYHYYIYWADGDGNFDSGRYTMLETSKYGSEGGTTSAMEPYVGRFNDDSLDDIVIGTHATWDFKDGDSNYLELFYGGENLIKQGKEARSDSVLFLSSGRVGFKSYQADYRGTGREDLVVFDYYNSHNWFFYRNDAPLTLDKLRRSLLYDTLFSINDNPDTKFASYQDVRVLPMRAFAKPTWDNSVDLLAIVKRSVLDFAKNSIFFFRGGEKFGSVRRKFDSSDFELHHPAFYDPSFKEVGWGQIHNCGDMTGTGNNVLHIGMGDRQTGYEAFYVTGKALDDKIDMTYFEGQNYSGYVDSLDANNDNFRDVLINFDRDPQGKGMIHLLYGKDKIPVRLNPLFSVKGQTIPRGNIDIYPNPMRDRAIVSFSSKQTERAVLKLYNVLGQTVYEEEKEIYSGVQSFKLQIPSLVTGSYLLEITSPTQHFKTHLAVTK